MAVFSKKCPVCNDGGEVDDTLVCRKCGNQLGYVDQHGTLAVESPYYRCRKCHTENTASSTYCETCGAQLARECPLCNGRHHADAKVCSKYGEPLESSSPPRHKITTIIAESFGLVLNRYRKAFMVPVAILALIAGYYGYERFSGHNGVPFPASGAPKIDVVFVVDSTGSMADEIQVIQEKIKEMMAKIRSGQPVPEVRFGLVAYRDRGDDYVCKKYDLTSDIQVFQQYVSTLKADGGGDTKEAVNEALSTALNEIAWDKDPAARKLIFLIGDAGPHMDYSNGLDYHKEAEAARNMGIRIHTLGCSGIEEDGEPEFRQIAEETGGSFDYLTYRQQLVDQSGATYYRFKSGKGYYSMDEKAARGDGWKEGIKAAIDRGMAKEEAPPASASALPGASGGSFKTLGPAQPQEQQMENNVDTFITKTVQKDAESLGVKYKK
ncbi:MAG: VWA domain-containing protein [Candidatus Xenobiia bacterium LiM19]